MDARPAGLYRIKPEVQRLLRPLEDGLVARQVSADAVTLSAIPLAALGGLAIALSTQVPPLLLLVPFIAAGRLILNLLDGQVARRTGTAHPMGEMLNELGDRLADVLFIGGLAFIAAVGPLLGSAAVIAAILSSYAGITARAIGAPRQYGGLMSKPGRMITLSVAAPLAFLTSESWPLVVAAAVIIIGSAATLVQRVRATRRALAAATKVTS